MKYADKKAVTAWIRAKVTLTALLAKMCATARSSISAPRSGMFPGRWMTVALLAVNLAEANAIRFLRPIGVAMLVMVVGPLFQSDFRVSAQTCHTCTLPCPYDDGFYCEPDGGGLGGTELCWQRVSHLPNPIDPDDEGRIDCFCVEQGDVCESDDDEEGVGFADRSILMREATDMVAAGDMLPSDGPFYVGVTASGFVLRRKCDGSVAGRVATEGSPLVAIGAWVG